jgi:hypothetical protein
MGKIGKKDPAAKPAWDGANNDRNSRKLPPSIDEEDDSEDGDIATPKRDRDDEQLDL